MASFGRFTSGAGGVVETLSYTSPTLSLTQSAGTSPLTATIAGGGVDGSGTTNYVSKWSDTDTLTDSLFFSDANIAKTIYDGEDKGLYCNFPNSSYKLGNSGNFLEIDTDNLLFTLTFEGDNHGLYLDQNSGLYIFGFNTNNGIQSSNNGDIIKTLYGGADKGLYIDFTAYDGTTNITISGLDNGNYLQFPNVVSSVYNENTDQYYRNHNFYSTDGLSSFQFGQYVNTTSEGGGFLFITIDKGNWGQTEDSLLYWNPEEGFNLYNFNTITLQCTIGTIISSLKLYGYESSLYNEGDGYNFALKLDTINQLIKTQKNGIDKGLYIDFANSIYSLGISETGDPLNEPIAGFNANITTAEYSMGDVGAYLSDGYIQLKNAETRLYIETNRTHLKNLTNEEIVALPSPFEGDVVYNSTLHVLCFYDGSGWKKVSHSAM